LHAGIVMIRLVRNLLSLPFYWLGRIAASLGVPAGVELLKLARAVSGDDHIAVVTIATIVQLQGQEAAGAQASEWVRRRPGPQLAAFAGMMVTEQGDLAEGANLLEMSRSAGDDPSGMADYLDLLLASRAENGDRFDSVFAKYEHRRDLSPLAKKLVVNETLWHAMSAGRYDEARAIARRMLDIEEDLSPRAVLWALCVREGAPRLGESHLRRAAEASPVKVLYYRALGAHHAGLADEEREALARLREQDEDLATAFERTIQSEGTPQ